MVKRLAQHVVPWKKYTFIKKNDLNLPMIKAMLIDNDLSAIDQLLKFEEILSLEVGRYVASFEFHKSTLIQKRFIYDNA